MQELDFEHLDHYQLLGVERNATADELKRAYRQQIIRYHPDRYTHHSPEEQEYARQRTLRINEAYSTLTNFAARSAYNRGSSAGQRTTVQAPPKPQTPPPPRDHQAELYTQARTHIDAGRYVQALASLRQLHKASPFYRDTAALLAMVEAQLQTTQSSPEPQTVAGEGDKGQRTRRWVLGGAIGSAVVAGAVAAVVGLRGQASRLFSGSTVVQSTSTPASGVASGPTIAPTDAPSPTIIPPTASPVPPSPTVEPTAVPTTAPTNTTVPTPTVEQGPVLLSEDFSRGGWANQQSVGWSVGYTRDQRYRITADPGVGNIWSYRTIPSTLNYRVAVDVEAVSGSAGLLVRYQDRSNYVVCLITPETGDYRVEQRSRGRSLIIDQGQSAAIDTAPGASNRVVVEVNETRLVMVVNDTTVVEAAIPTMPRTQQYGVVATAGEGTVEGLFDNLEVRALAER